MKISISATQPFSLPTVVRSHGWVQLAPFEVIGDYDGFSYIHRYKSGRVGTFQVTGTNSGVQVACDQDLNPAELNELQAVITWMLGLEQDFSAFYQKVGSEPKLASVAQLAKGRLLRSPTLFEDTIRTILTTNTAWSGTKRMVRTLVTELGSPLPGHPDQHAFPTPAQIVAVDVEHLRQVIRLGYRSPYVWELARQVDSGELDLESFRTSDLPTIELRKQLLALIGVGNYAAAHLLLFLGRYDYIPIDSWALASVSKEWHGGEPIGPAEVEEAFARWGEWKGLAFWFWNWGDQSE